MALSENVEQSVEEWVSYYKRLVSSEDVDSALSLAVKEGRLDVIHHLLQLGVDINKPDRMGRYPLFLACHTGRLDMVQCLVEHGAAINNVTDSGMNVVLEACTLGHLDIVKYLVEKGADARFITERSGSTGVHLAAASGNVELIEFLTQQGVDVHALDKEGCNALHFALEGDYPNVVTFLLRKGVQQVPKRKPGHDRHVLQRFVALGTFSLLGAAFGLLNGERRMSRGDVNKHMTESRGDRSHAAGQRSYIVSDERPLMTVKETTVETKLD